MAPSKYPQAPNLQLWLPGRNGMTWNPTFAKGTSTKNKATAMAWHRWDATLELHSPAPSGKGPLALSVGKTQC